MNKIDIRGTSTDCLDGLPLKDGEKLSVQFPNGEIETHAIKVKTFRKPIQIGTITLSEAYVEIRYQGAYAWIRIVGFPAERVN